MFISSRSRQGPHCQAARANWKDLGRRFKRKLLEHFHFYKITHQFLFLLPLELLRSQKSNTKRIHIPLSVLRELSQGGDRACPCARFLRHQPGGPPGTCHQPGAWGSGCPGGRQGGSCDFLTANVFFSVFIHNIYRESSSNALLSFIFEAADGWFLHQSSRNRCLAALREELTLYETFPKWAHLPRSASQQKPPSASGAALSNPLPRIQTPHT